MARAALLAARVYDEFLLREALVMIVGWIPVYLVFFVLPVLLHHSCM
jgi:hypothetical protein